MELSLIGLQNSGKTSLVNVIAVSKLFVRGLVFYLLFISLSFGLMLMVKFLFLELFPRLVDIVKT
jgi:AAA+ ATPase superfamily predicted ATPase